MIYWPTLLALFVSACGDPGNRTVTDTGNAMDAAADSGIDTGIDRPVGPCVSNTDCAGQDPGLRACDPVSGRCVACVASSDDCPAAQHCDGAAHACVPGCRNDDGCVTPGADGGRGAHCDAPTHTCVQCVTSDHCPPGLLCAGNICAAGCDASHPCPAALSCCTGACVDMQADAVHCGSCSQVCSLPGATAACVAGACAVGSCAAHFADCDRAPANGCESDLSSDLAACGSCNSPCASRAHAASSCTSGLCGFTCEAGFADCDADPASGCETDTVTNAAHCGGCGQACTYANASASCVVGECAMGACAPGFADCDGDPSNGCEMDTGSSVANCGSCGHACHYASGAAICVAGACGLSACDTGQADCDGDPGNGCETALLVSVAHCGACGHACSLAGATAACAAGVCAVATWNPGFADCNGSAGDGCEVDTGNSLAHCGSCSTTCGAAQACVSGACLPLASCQAIRTQYPTTPSGPQDIDPDGPGGAAPIHVRCEMIGAEGWTLVMMAGTSPVGTFGFDAAAWTDTSVVNDTVVDPAVNANVKSMAFNTLPVTAMRLCLGTYAACLVEPVTASSARAVFSGSPALGSRTTPDFLTWGYAGTLGCNRVGFNVYDVGAGSATASRARCRYGILLNNELTCEGSVDGGRGLGCRGYFGTQVSAGQGDGIVSTSHERGWIFVR
ncbi:MAG: fibrinogen-like YCDxxxxGGGW domain-containing protein [Deltaproteobacteria bacterium]